MSSTVVLYTKSLTVVFFLSSMHILTFGRRKYHFWKRNRSIKINISQVNALTSKGYNVVLMLKRLEALIHMWVSHFFQRKEQHLQLTWTGVTVNSPTVFSNQVIFSSFPVHSL